MVARSRDSEWLSTNGLVLCHIRSLGRRRPNGSPNFSLIPRHLVSAVVLKTQLCKQKPAKMRMNFHPNEMDGLIDPYVRTKSWGRLVLWEGESI